MTVRTEVIALLDGIAGLGQRNYADNAPDGIPFPYAVVIDGISMTPDLRGDSATMWWKWMGQVDVWEQAGSEDEALYPAVVRALDGAKLTAGMHLEVQSSLRIPDPATDVVHRAITVRTSQPA